MFAMSRNWLALLLIQTVTAIGENPMDLQMFANVISGLGHMMKHQVDTVDVPAELIMGKWFQVYKAAVNFDMYRTQMFCPIAYFKQNRVMGEDGFSIEEAYRVVSKNGPIETYKRDLNKSVLESIGCTLKIYIVNAGPKFDNETKPKDADIQYIVVTDASRMGLMVYARDPMTFYQKYNKEVTEFLEEAGFGGRIFWNSPRPIYQGADCEWPSEKEVFARRVLKNHENAIRAQNSTETPASALADMLKNPEVVLKKLVQMH